MAHYDTGTKKIKGCKINSPIWWHEMGHKYMDEMEIDIQIHFFKDILIFISIVFLIFNLKLISLYCIILSFVLYFGEELGAWIYALIKIKKWNK